MMKEVIVAAILASSMVVMAEEVAKSAEEAPVSPVVVEAVKPVKRGPRTEEQRAEMRAKREKFMAERRAEMEKKALEVIKKYGLDDEKAKALWNELNEVMRPARRPRPIAAPAPKAE